MNVYTIKKDDKLVKGKITIPSSKSISNRVLIINALSNSFAPVYNLSDCDDTRSMLKVLNSNANCFDIGHAGTTMRFLTAYLSRIIGKWEITGSERMLQRPIGVLVDALNHLGAQIEYIEKEGYPPLRILGSNLTGNEVTLKGNTSSQFISALLLIAPYLPEGLTMRLVGEVVSVSYIDLTLSIMGDFGIKSYFKDNVIRVERGNYGVMPYTVESDWSGVSYLYEILALSDGGEIKLEGLKKNSYQGDAAQVGVWEKLGVKTVYNKRGMFIKYTGEKVKRLEQDFNNMPDLAQTFAVVCAGLGIPFYFTGLETLKIKETDRISALIAELGKLGYGLYEPQEGALAWDGGFSEVNENIEIETYKDHRMALAFAPLAMKLGEIKILNPDVVNKSYPEYWEDLKSLGFTVE